MPGLLCRELDGELCPSRMEFDAKASMCLASLGHEEVGTTEIHQRIIELHDSLRPPLHAYLSCLGVSSEHAEDIIQETFLRHLQGRCGDHNLRAWTFRVAHNLSMDHHRSQQRWSVTNDGDSHPAIRERIDARPNPEQQLILAERMKRLANALALLTPKQRHCVRLRSKGLRYREIAPILGITVQRVGELMQRAITVLAAGL